MVSSTIVRPASAVHRSIPTDTHQLFTIRQAAQRKGIGFVTVSRAVQARRLPHQRFGHQDFITPAARDAWQPHTERAPRKYRHLAPDLSVVPTTLTQASLDRATLEASVTTLANAMIQHAGSLRDEQRQEANQILSRILLDAEAELTP